MITYVHLLPMNSDNTQHHTLCCGQRAKASLTQVKLLADVQRHLAVCQFMNGYMSGALQALQSVYSPLCCCSALAVLVPCPPACSDGLQRCFAAAVGANASSTFQLHSPL